MTYIAVSDVRLFTNISIDDISDDKITSLIPYATAQLNRDINVKVTREKVDQIDNWRENKIDALNTLYYTKTWEGHYLSDDDDDGDVDASDVSVIQVDGNGDESTLAVSSVSSVNCSITLSSAPASGVSLYLTYQYTHVPVYPTPHVLVKLACVYLVASMAYSRLLFGQPTSFSVGEIRVATNIKSVEEYLSAYESIISKINNNMISSVEHESIF